MKPAAAQIDTIFAAMEKLTADELAYFLDESWIDNDAFIRRLNAALIAEDFPDDDASVFKTAYRVMESSALALLAARDWIEDYLGD